MTQPGAHTGAQDLVVGYANAALEASTGVTLYWRIAQYGTAERCKHMARSFQTSFSSFRARYRKKVAGFKHDSTHIASNYSKYDRLICRSMPLEDGSWSIELMRSEASMGECEVIDNATGERIDAFNPRAVRMSRMAQQSIHDGPGAVSAEDRAWYLAETGLEWFDYTPLPLKGSREIDIASALAVAKSIPEPRAISATLFKPDTTPHKPDWTDTVGEEIEFG